MEMYESTKCLSHDCSRVPFAHRTTFRYFSKGAALKRIATFEQSEAVYWKYIFMNKRVR